MASKAASSKKGSREKKGRGEAEGVMRKRKEKG
jgi:hypothetical protein